MFDIKLQKAMDKCDLTLSQLSDMTGINRSSISQYLSGKNEPRDNVKKILGEVLGCDFLGKEVEINQGYGPFIFSTESIKLRVAARVLHKSEHKIVKAMVKGNLPIGYVLDPGDENTPPDYYISPKLLYEVTGWRE
ncbi:MAG: helix-turn-helix domain-containing protein [Lachnospirales bacterium]